MLKPFRAVSSVALCAVMLFTSAAVAGAAEIEDVIVEETAISAAAGEPGIEPQVEYVFVWKYRVYNGQRQKRRWNETLGIWADLMWINC